VDATRKIDYSTLVYFQLTKKKKQYKINKTTIDKNLY
jgi:hypothetical protein